MRDAPQGFKLFATQQLRPTTSIDVGAATSH